MNTVVPAEERVVLENISWQTYVALADEASGRRGRITYRKGAMEIMSPSRRHELATSIVSLMLFTWFEKHRIDSCSTRSTTFRRDDLQLAFEADESYYISNAAAIRGLEEIDLQIHPAPDLAIEVDISRRAMAKTSIYEALGVGEVWIFDGEVVRVLVRNDSGRLIAATESSELPGFPLHLVAPITTKARELGETAAIREFRDQI